MDSINFGFDIKDVPTMVDFCMKKQYPKLNRLNGKDKSDQLKLSLYGQLSGLINTFQQSIDNINQAAQSTGNFSIATNNASLLSATITSTTGLYAGTHTVIVTKLASANALQCNNTVSSNTGPLSLSGDVSFTMGSSSFDVTINSTDSLVNIRDNINNAPNNTGATASIVQSTDPGTGLPLYSLVIAADQTGAASQITVGGSLGGTGNQFDFGNQLSAAQNAEFTFDNANEVRTTNQISDVCDGMSFNLLGLGTSTVTVSNNQNNLLTSVQTAIQTMVDGYNQIIGLINQNFAQSAADRVPSDETLQAIKESLCSLVGQTLTVASAGSINGLASLGITQAPATTITATPSRRAGDLSEWEEKKVLDPVSYTATGALQLNTAAIDPDLPNLPQVLTDNMADVLNFFSDVANGFTKLADTTITGMTTNVVQTQINFVNQDKARLSNLISEEEARLGDVRQHYIKKFSSLLAFVKRSEGVSNALGKQLDVINYRR